MGPPGPSPCNTGQRRQTRRLDLTGRGAGRPRRAGRRGRRVEMGGPRPRPGVSPPAGRLGPLCPSTVCLRGRLSSRGPVGRRSPNRGGVVRRGVRRDVPSLLPTAPLGSSAGPASSRYGTASRAVPELRGTTQGPSPLGAASSEGPRVVAPLPMSCRQRRLERACPCLSGLMGVDLMARCWWARVRGCTQGAKAQALGRGGAGEGLPQNAYAPTVRQGVSRREFRSPRRSTRPA